MKKIKRFTAARIGFLLLFCLLIRAQCVAAVSAGGTLPASITVVCDDNYAPYAFRDFDGKLQGIVVDQWTLWSKKTGIPAVITGMQWNAALKAMENGRADVIDTIFQTKERNLLYDFTPPYASIEVPIFFSSEISGITDPASLRGFLVAVKEGDACINVLQKYGVDNFIKYSDYSEIINNAAKNRVKIFCMDKPPAVYLMNKAGIMDRFRFTQSVYTGEFCRAVKKNEYALLSAVKTGFSQISQSEYRAIDRKWKGESLRAGILIKYIVIGIGVVGFFLLLLFLWNVSLVYQVNSKTLELKNAVKKSEESEEKYRGLVDASSMAIALIADNKWSYANQALLDLFGYTKEEFLKLQLTDIMPDTPRGKSLVYENYKKRMAGEPNLPSQYEVQFLKKSGEIMEGILSVAKISAGGKPGVIAAFQDITALKRAQDQEKKHQEELFQASKMVALGTLVSGVAHEINNPNNFIMLNAPILYKSWMDAKPLLDKYYKENGDFKMAGMNYSEMRENMKDLFAGIEEGAKRIKDIVANLKNFARKDNSDLDQKVDLNEVVKSSVTLLANLIKKSTDNFSIKYCENRAFVRGNFQRLEQVVINILQNACQALADKTKNIRVELACNSSSIFVRIKDEGCGIQADILPQVTDPFFTTKRDSGGTGLGLSISDGIIKDHNGKMEIISEPGRGTTVLIVLPAFKE